MNKKSKSRLERHRLTLQHLARSNIKNKTRQNIVKEGGKDLRSCICECALNVLKENVPLSKNQWIKLKRLRKPIEVLASKRVPVKKKKTIIQQKGGRLFPLLFTPIIKALAGAVI